MKYYERIVNLPEDYSFFLFGPRQVGKSTLVKQIFHEENTLTYNLLNFDVVRKLNRDPSLFREEIKSRDHKKITHVFIDEVQKLPWLLDEVHYIIEETKNPPYFILTGSSARKLKKTGVNMLAGRAIKKYLFPLTFPELYSTEKEKLSLQKILELGTLPVVYLSETGERAREILKSYVGTYLKEEIKEEALVRNLNAFSDFLLFASEENGNIINYSNISQDIGLSSNSVKEYYQILEDTLIGFKLEPLKKSVRQRISKSPKFYFFDTGVQRALSEKLSVPLYKGMTEYGRTFEHWLIKEIVHLTKYKEKDYRLSYYRTENGVEVDLIVEMPSKQIFAIEIKASENPVFNDLKGLISFKNNFPKAKLYCASLTKYPRSLERGITVLPWQEIFKILKLV